MEMTENQNRHPRFLMSMEERDEAERGWRAWEDHLLWQNVDFN